MNDPVKQEIGWSDVVRINLQIIGGLLASGYGWVCWQIANSAPEWWAFWGIAYLAYAGGVLMIGKGLVRATRLIRNLRRWRRYERLGSTPKADHMVRDEDFGPGGHIS